MEGMKIILTGKEAKEYKGLKNRIQEIKEESLTEARMNVGCALVIPPVLTFILGLIAQKMFNILGG